MNGLSVFKPFRTKFVDFVTGLIAFLGLFTFVGVGVYSIFASFTWPFVSNARTGQTHAFSEHGTTFFVTAVEHFLLTNTTVFWVVGAVATALRFLIFGVDRISPPTRDRS